MTKQITNTVLMIRPANFGFNTETAENNAFQTNDTSITKSEIASQAKVEFDAFVGKLRAVGVFVIIVEDTIDPLKTDAVFPNNWISTHRGGSIVTYPMYSANRRLERRDDVIDLISEHYEINDISDYLEFEDKGIFVEGTGSMILDRDHEIVYACISERSHPDLLTKIASDFGYRLVAFHANDAKGIPYYHTNVIMALGSRISVICLESISNDQERQLVRDSLSKTGKIIIDISRHQVEHFAGNMLEVYGQNEQKYMVMSSAAYHILTPSQISKIESEVKILHTDLSTIEKYGGGSARCMLAEIYLS